MHTSPDRKPPPAIEHAAADRWPMVGVAFQLFIDNVRDYAIFMLDPDGHIATWNKGAERIKGYTAAEILGKHFSILYTEADRRRHHPDEVLAIARRTGHHQEENWRVRKDGSRFWASVVITAVRGRNGELLGFGKVTRDLTERKRQEERERHLQRERTARAEAEAANRAKSEFLTAMSHELRTPLNAVMGYVDLLDHGVYGPITGEQAQSLDRIRKSSEYLLRLISGVLNLSRIEAGQVDYDIRDVPVNGAIEAVTPLVAPQFRAKRIAFSVTSCAPGIAMRTDSTRLQQILLNLLSNAHKFTPRGGRISVFCESDEMHVRIHVRDTGPGIAPERLAAIFEPFVQLGRGGADETRQPGVGLGLAISRDIARAMHGDITVESEPGRGSTFTLRLPRSTNE
ncbi:MAG TPA: PAS domain-containing sensor histidine kinase [Longimicrobiales bacterium]